MRIGIDARMLNASGIGRYVTNLILELQKIDQKNSYFVFLLKKDLNQIKFNKNFTPVIADFIWYSFREQLEFPKILKQQKLDLVHFPHLNVPIFYQGKFIVTIHDLTHMDFKMSRASAHNRIYYEIKHQTHKGVMLSALKRSQQIITPSNFVKEEIVTRFDINPTKIAVTLEAADGTFLSLIKKINPPKAKKVLEKYGIKPPFLFYVGNAHPHKNIDGLIKAFGQLRQKYQYLQLVLSGKEDFFWQRLKQEINEEDVIFTGFVNDNELIAFYKSAQAYIFPSFSEGFGIPLLEAMACGCPVVSSNKTALPEVGGDAALYFDPYNQEDMVEKIIQILNNQKLRKSLIEKGEKRVQQFSWQKMAKQTLEVYAKCG